MKKFFTTLIFIALLIVFGLYLYSNIIDIGLKLRNQSIYLEISYYVLCGLLFYFLILKPFLVVLFSPYYSISRYCDENESNNSGLVHKAKRLLKYGCLSDEDKSLLKEAINKHGNGRKIVLSQRMYIIYNNQIKKNIDKIVVQSSRDTLILTGVSQSRFVDALTVAINNFRMIKKIVVMCGFRPTFIRTMKIYIKIFSSSLIADGLQQVELSSLISTSLAGTAKLLTDSAANGAINAFFMLRIGMLTKQYLYTEDPHKRKIGLLNNAITEAIKLFPQVLAEVITSPIKGIASLFKPQEKKNIDTDLENIPEVNWSKK